MPLSSADAPPITRIDVFPALYGVTAYFRFFPKPERPSVFVRVTCEDNTAGLGKKRDHQQAKDDANSDAFECWHG